MSLFHSNKVKTNSVTFIIRSIGYICCLHYVQKRIFNT